MTRERRRGALLEDEAVGAAEAEEAAESKATESGATDGLLTGWLSPDALAV